MGEFKRKPVTDHGVAALPDDVESIEITSPAEHGTSETAVEAAAEAGARWRRRRAVPALT